MTTYQVISEAKGVPPMTDLEAVYVDEPSPRDCGSIAFATSYHVEASRYEPAVGRRCRVIRMTDGRDVEKWGAVQMVTPLRVSLDGGPWAILKT